jgi:hypothetical protein
VWNTVNAAFEQRQSLLQGLAKLSNLGGALEEDERLLPQRAVVESIGDVPATELLPSRQAVLLNLEDELRECRRRVACVVSGFIGVDRSLVSLVDGAFLAHVRRRDEDRGTEQRCEDWPLREPAPHPLHRPTNQSAIETQVTTVR